MKDAIKTGLALAATAGLSLALGFGAMNAYRSSTPETPPIVQSGDYTKYFSQTGGRIVLFGTSTCPYCAQLRDYLAERQVPFVDLVVDMDNTASELYAELGARTVPVLLVGNTRINGFSREHIDPVLNAYPAIGSL